MSALFILQYIFYIFILTQIIQAKQECALNTICKHIKDCPLIRDNFHSFYPKPYCNLHLPSTYVCCYIPPTQYIQEKDKELRIVKECKSYQEINRQCDVPLIVDGTKAEAKEFPFMALLYYKNDDKISYKCGGTLISKNYVLTAAHCFTTVQEPNWVRLGELDHSTTTDDASPQDISIKTIILSPQYKTEMIYNDIALVETSTDIQFNDYVAPACLPLIDSKRIDDKFLATGWGFIQDTGESTTHLQKVILDHFQYDQCFQLIERNYELQYGVDNRSQLCAGSFTDNRDTCNGDSGGPLFIDHPDFKCQFLVLGITSFGQGGCGNKGFPAIYTRVSYYVNWIESIVWN